MIKKINFYLILLIIFLLPSYLIRFFILSIPTTLLEILIYTSAILTLFSKVDSKNIASNFKNNKLLIPVILFIIAGFMGILFSPDKKVALGQFRAFIFDPILFFWIITKNIQSYSQIKKMLWAFIASGIYVSAHALWQYLSGQLTSDARIIGIFGYSPNYLAFYMVPVTLIAIFYFWQNRKNNLLADLIKILLLILFIFTIIITGSRGAIIALIGSIVLAYFIKYLKYSKINKSFKIVLVIVFLLAISFSGYVLIKPDFSLSQQEAGRIGSSNNIRWEIWKTTFNDIILKDSYFFTGIGLGNYQNYFSEITKDRVNYPEWISPKALTPHNLFLQFMVNLGILGLIAFIWILYLFFKNINLKNNLSFIIFLVILSILIQGMVDTPYWKNDLALIFWLLVFMSLFINKKKA